MHATFELSGVRYGVAPLAVWTSAGEYDPAESTFTLRGAVKSVSL